MRSNATVVFAAAALILAVAPWAAAQSPQIDLTGTWTMQATVQLPMEEPAAQELSKGVAVPMDCQYEGTAEIVDQNGDLSGTVDLMLITGPPGCPMDMSAMLMGGAQPGEAIGSTQVDGILMGGNLDDATFTGIITDNPGGQGGVTPNPQGPFGGASGTWTAQLQQSVLEIPTVSALGLLLLTVLILAAGTLLLRHVTSA